MRLALLTALTMVAFAANSILNRLALDAGDMGAGSFALIRVLSGAAMLMTLVVLTGQARVIQRPSPRGLASAAVLTAYLIGFSYAYVQLEAGLGALILFGAVQLTMFAGALVGGERIGWLRWLGMALALSGLIYLLLPGQAHVPPIKGVALMVAAAIGWGIYSLLGRRAIAPMPEAAMGFVLSIPLVLLAWLVFSRGEMLSVQGVVLALASGALTSGLGYALWYAILPRLEASMAAIAQLTVPLIAMAGGALVLQEAVTSRFLIAAMLILAGILVALKKPGPR